MNEVQVLLADDHALVRAGLRMLVDQFAGFCVVAEAKDGREAIRLTRQMEPDIALLDLSMPGLNGLDALPLIVNSAPKTQVIILSMHVSENYVIEALRLGAVGYVAKDAAVDDLECALRAVQRGDRWLSRSVSHYLINEYLRVAYDWPMAKIDIALLTPRQREILQLIAEGCATREIAERLFISVKTAETHRTQIMKRLNIHDVAGLTRFAIRHGLVDPEK